MKNYLVLLAASIVYFQPVNAQNFTPCLTDQIYQQAIIEHPELIKIEERANELARAQVASVVSNKKGAILVIPVVFHIIHQNGTENISQGQIMDQIRILNEDYRKKTGTNGGTSTDPLAIDMEVEFRLAQYDPNGKKHDGIIRINSTLGVNADNGVKSLSYWPCDRYLNIWVVSSINNSISGQTGTILGYAQFPTQKATQPLTDGIVVRADQIGVIGSGMTNQAGRTLTHEIGHWLGLYHPFQNGCVGGTSSNCASQGDQVCDTPPVASASFGCTAANTCHNDLPDLSDLIKNYMDYADGTCMNMFTSGQKARVYGMSFSGPGYRSNAASVSNLNSTGIDASGNYLPANASVIKAPYNYNFESSSLVNDGWVINNFNTPSNGWQVTTTAAKSGNNSISMRNFNNGAVPVNSRDGFQSPEIDLTTVTSPYLSFYYAYAQKSVGTNDILNLTISNTFGMQETNIMSSIGNYLATTGIQSTDFVPAASQWKFISIDLSPYKTFTNARFRFEFLNRRGNNIYLDDIAVTNGPLSGLEDLKSAVKFNIHPNPMNDNTTISFELKQSGQVKINLVDVMGRVVFATENNLFNSGEHEININKNNLKPGVYFIRFETPENSFNHKLLIN